MGTLLPRSSSSSSCIVRTPKKKLSGPGPGYSTPRKSSLAEGSNIDKILKELSHNHTSIAADKALCSKHRQAIVETSKQIREQLDQYEIFRTRLKELFEQTASKTGEFSLYKTKKQVYENQLNQQKKYVQASEENFAKAKMHLGMLGSEILSKSINFGKEWNCSDSGYDVRSTTHKTRVDEMKNNVNILEDELDDYFLMERDYQYSEVELLDLRKKAREAEEECKSREQKIREKIQETNAKIQDLTVRKDEIALSESVRQEIQRLDKEISNCKDMTCYWERRVNDFQNQLDKQSEKNEKFGIRRPASLPFKQNTPTKRLYQSRLSFNATQDAKPQTPSKVQNISYEKEQDQSSSQAQNSSQYFSPAQTNYTQISSSQSQASKAPRMFQFKKKSNVGANER